MEKGEAGGTGGVKMGKPETGDGVGLVWLADRQVGRGMGTDI